MRLLLVIAILLASLTYTGIVKAQELCVASSHECSHDMAMKTDKGGDTQKEKSCMDCCLHSHMTQATPVQPPFQFIRAVTDFNLAADYWLADHTPSGILRPPKFA